MMFFFADYMLDKPIFLNVYTEAGKSFASNKTVDHGKGEYVRDKAHINTAEGYFSQLKRSIDGTHHHVSA
jgi:ISXO2-like transposase domain